MLLLKPPSEGAPDWLRNFPKDREDLEGTEVAPLLENMSRMVAPLTEEAAPEVHVEHLIFNVERLVKELEGLAADGETPAREEHPMLGVAAMDALDAKLAELEATANVGDPDTIRNLFMVRIRLVLFERSLEKDAADDPALKGRVATWKRRIYGLLARQFDTPLADDLPAVRPPAPEEEPAAAREEDPVAVPPEAPIEATPPPPRSLLATLSEQRAKVVAVVAALLLAAAGASYVGFTKDPDESFGERVEEIGDDVAKWVDRQLDTDPPKKKKSKKK
jgi:hypothetical protein